MKHLKALGHLLTWGVSFLTIRNKKKWVFGSFYNFSGNAKYLFLDKSVAPDTRFIWITKSRGEARDLTAVGFENVYHARSWKGIYHLLTASVYVYSSFVSDISLRCSGRALRVNLWHGVGIKVIERKIVDGQFDQIFRSKGILNWWRNFTDPFRFRHTFNPHILLSTSPLMTEHFSECFGVDPSRCVEALYPRNEILTWDEERLRGYIAESEPSLQQVLERIKDSRYTYMYMPTWRDNGESVFEYSSIDLEVLNETLASKSSYMLVKLHPMSPVTEEDVNYSNIIFIERTPDVYPILPFTDCLITDYSSILYDYLLMKDKDMVLYVPDYEEYMENCRDLAYPFDENTCGLVIRDFEGLIECVEHYDSTKFYTKEYRDRIDYIRHRFWGDMNGDNKRIVDRVKSTLESSKF